MAEGATTEREASHDPRFARAKFRPTTLPTTLVTRSVLHDQLTAGADKRLTMVVGSAGAGKSVLLSSWAAARSPDTASWLSCDGADANPVRFWTGFIEAPQAVAPGFGADAADVLAMDGGVMSADVTASIANDAAKLPAGSAIIVDDFHYAAPAVARDMTDLVERWPSENAQLILSTRVDPSLRLHRLRMAGELCELRDSDLYFSLDESRDLLANFGVGVGAADLAALHERSEGWAAALQMVALSLRATQDPARVARVMEVRSNAIGEYFIAEVLDQQPPDVAQFMLDISILSELTADACAAVTSRQDAAVLLHSVDAANLFLVALDDDRTSFRYHHLVRQLLRAELRTKHRAREQELQLRAGEWFEVTGDARRAARHFLAARQADRALALLQDRAVEDYLRDPALPPPLDLSTVDPVALAEAPDRLLGLAIDLVLSGDTARAGEYLDLLERSPAPFPPDSRLAARVKAARAMQYMQTGRAAEAVREALAARAIQQQTGFIDEGVAAAMPAVLPRGYTWLEDFPAVERETAEALAAPEIPAPVKLVLVPGSQALARLEAGHLTQAAEAAKAAEEQARRLGFGQHFFAVDYLRALSGLALERRDLDTAEQRAEQALSIAERGRRSWEFLALLERAGIWAARGQVHDALATIETARQLLAGTGSELLARADELEAVLRLSLGDPRTPAELAAGLPAARRALLQAKIALAVGDHQTAAQRLRSTTSDELTPRRALERQLLLAAAAIERADPMIADILASALETARHGGFCNTVVTTAPQVTSHLVEHSGHARPDPFLEKLITAALQVRAVQSAGQRSPREIIEPLSPAELRILKLLPTSNYTEIAATFFISHNTLKAHLRSIYRKLGATSRSEAIERAVDLRLL